jgi:hypothetical protein
LRELDAVSSQAIISGSAKISVPVAPEHIVRVLVIYQDHYVHSASSLVAECIFSNGVSGEK